jgi:putative membrane protein
MAEATPASPPQAEATRRSDGIHVPTWVAAVVAGFIVLGIGFGVGWGIGDHGDGRRRFGDHGGGRGIGFIVFLALIALIITAVILVVRHFVSRPQGARHAENLLAERFARGEIDEAEYQRRRAALRG